MIPRTSPLLCGIEVGAAMVCGRGGVFGGVEGKDLEAERCLSGGNLTL